MGLSGLSLLITGAGGFLGQAVVAAALKRGHTVRAMVRRETTLPEGAIAQISDLGRDPIDLRGIDAVIHCAAAMTGDDTDQERDTIGPTRALVDAMIAAPKKPRMVLVSSLSVYGYGSLGLGDSVTESTALETAPQDRDAYTRAKLAQEALANALTDVWLIRAGVIYGPGRTWNAHIGVGLGPVLLRIGNKGEIPLIHVDDCATGLVQAVETPSDRAQALNLIGDELPDRPTFFAAHKASGWPRYSVPLPWQTLLLAGRIFAMFPRPGLLRPPVLKARMMPLRYPNDAAKTALNWAPQIPFQAGMAAALGATP